jgi:dihydroorotase-like cyclic amidohydrolase
MVHMFETVIRNGNIVIPGRCVCEGDIGIERGKIAAISGPGQKMEGKNVIDAGGKHIFPGIIEPHSHLGIGAGADDLTTETRSAAIGGVTSVLFFLRQPTPYDDIYCEIKRLGEEKSFIDFSFHIVLMTDEHLKSIPKYIDKFGVTSFKFYMTYRGENANMSGFGGKMMQFAGIDDGYMLDCFKAVAQNPRAVVIVHAEDIEIINRCRKRLVDEGRDDMEAYALSRPVFAEVEGVRRALAFAGEAGCSINILHVTAGDALEAIASFKKEYDRAYAEVCHPYLVLSEDDARDSVFKLRPPFRKRADIERLWKGAKTGDVYTIGSDHVPRKLSEKLGSVWRPAAGAPGTPFLLPIMLSEGYHKRGLPLPRIAELLSLNPARLYHLPEKGDIRVGADADLVIVDIQKEHTLRAADIEQFSDYILQEGLKVKGYPELTMVRGRIVAENGRVTEAGGWGKYISR